MSTERWAPVRGYEGLYEISDRGRVKSLDRVIKHARLGQQHISEKILVLKLRKGRYTVMLTRENVRASLTINRMVAVAFVPCEAHELEVCHNDGNAMNNNASNLRWDTRSENALDAVRHGTHFNAAKTHCPQGHEYSASNTSIQRTGFRRCLTCHSIRERNRRAQKRA